jgi:ATP-dependent Clp protease ATP-binding subunit ClpC
MGVLRYAQQYANARASAIWTDDILRALLPEREGRAGQVLAKLGIQLSDVERTSASMPHGGERETVHVDDLGAPTSHSAAVLIAALKEADRAQVLVGTEHLLLGLLIEGQGTAAAILANLGITEDGVRRELSSHPTAQGPDREDDGA